MGSFYSVVSGRDIISIFLCGSFFILILSSACLGRAQNTGGNSDLDVASQLEQSRQLSEKDPQASLKIAQGILKISEERTDPVLEAQARHCIGIAQKKMGLYKSAVHEITIAADIFKSQELKKEEANTHNTLGLIHSDQGEFTLALEEHLKALSIRREIQDLQGLAYSYNNLGNNLRNMGELEESLKYHFQAVEIKKELDNPGSLAYSYNNIGHTYRRLKDYDKALEYYEMALQIRQEKDDKSGVAGSLNNMGTLLEAEGKLEEALDYYQAGLRMRRLLGHKRAEAGSLNNVGSVLRQMGRPKEALEYLFQSLKLTESISAPVISVDTLECISETYADQGQYQKALEFHKKYFKGFEEIFNQTNSKKLMELQIQFETLEKELEIDHLQLIAKTEKKSTDQRFQLFLLLVGVIMLILFLLVHRFLYIKRTSEQYRLLSLDLELKSQQLAEANIGLDRLARSDSLTGLVNRRGFDEQIRKEYATARRKEEFLSILMLDVDFFKGFNDAFGHQAGDNCLRKISEIILKEVQRPEDTVCRYGGEEFAIILGNTPRQGALLVAERIRGAVEEAKISCSAHSPFPYLTVSIGVHTLIPSSNETPDELVKMADTALYEAKRKGRNCVVYN